MEEEFEAACILTDEDRTNISEAENAVDEGWNPGETETDMVNHLKPTTKESFIVTPFQYNKSPVKRTYRSESEADSSGSPRISV